MKHEAPLQMTNIAGIWRPPFSDAGSEIVEAPAGVTLAELAARMTCLPPDFLQTGEITVGGVLVPREQWHRVRLKPGQAASFHLVLAGSDSGGSARAALAIVIAVATILTAGLVATAGIPLLNIAAGTLGAKLISAGITVAGSLAANALSAPPAPAQPSITDQQSREAAASIAGNVIAPGGYLPAVLGWRRVYPPVIAKPLIERIGDDEYAEAVFALACPHEIGEIYVDDGPIGDATDVEYEVREGLDTDEPLSLVSRYGGSKDLGIELSAHQVEDDDQQKLVNQSNPEKSVPVFHRFATAPADEIWLDLAMLEGFSNFDTPNQEQAMPFRLRVRPLGTTTWLNLPEIVFAGKYNRAVKPVIKLFFAEHRVPAPRCGTNEGWVAAYWTVDGQTSPASETWEAHSSFFNGGSDPFSAGYESAGSVKGIALEGQTASFYLEPGSFPKGRYEVEIKRGAMLRLLNFDIADHATDGTDLFWYQGSAGNYEMARDREHLADRVFLQRASFVVNEHPVAGGKAAPGYALVAVKVRNRSISRVGVDCGAYMPTWDGSAFTGSATSDNPGDQVNFLLRGLVNARPLPDRVTDVQALGDFFEHCDTQGFTCNLVIEGARLGEALQRVTGCGRGRIRQGETWGVIIDYDRSGEDGVQTFTPRNSAGLSFTNSFGIIPDALRVSFRDATDGDRARQIIVFRPSREGVLDPLIEDIEYQGLVYEADVRERAVFDLNQMEKRAVFWNWTAPAEALRCKRGQLVKVNHDIVEEEHDSARVTGLDVRNGQLHAVYLDSRVQLFDEARPRDIDDPALSTRPSTWGRVSAMEIRRSDSTFSVHALSGASGERDQVNLETPVAIATDEDGNYPIRRGDLCVFGATGNINKRLIVTDMKWKRGLICQLTAVDEAPELHS